MTTSTVSSNVTAAEMRQLIAMQAANLPPPEVVVPLPARGELCAHAHDTGEPAFVGLPCRGSRVECRKTGAVTYAAACRDGRNCKFYTEKLENE